MKFVGKENRIEWIDSIRGIAALLVVFHHVKGLLNLPEYWNVLDTGKIGVVMFFFVSGFVIPFSLVKSSGKPILSFVVARFFRLYPMYWVSIVLTMLLLGPQVSNIELFLNLTMLQKFFGFNDLLGVFWTLQIELIFYGLCVLLFTIGYLQKNKAIFVAVYSCLAIAFLMSIARHLLHIKLPVALPLAIAVMFMGTLWRKHCLKENGVNSNNIYVVFAVFFILVFPISLLAYNVDFGNGEVWYMYCITYTIAPILFLSLTTFARLKSKFPIFLGRISYSIYLVHLIIIGVITKHMPFLSPVATSLLVFATTILVSSINFYLIESPLIDLGKKAISSFRDYNLYKKQSA